jgi:hypothetical protein
MIRSESLSAPLRWLRDDSTEIINAGAAAVAIYLPKLVEVE